MEKTQIPHYGRLTAPVKNGGAVKWTYRFSRYDADFIRKCAQALMDQTAQTERVFLVAGNGVQRDVLPELRGWKLTEHPGLAGNLKGLKLVLRDPELLTVSFTAGNDTVTVEADPVFSEDTLTMLMDSAVHIALTGPEAQADAAELKQRIEAMKLVDKLEKDMEAQKSAQAPGKKGRPKKKITFGWVMKKVLLVAALCGVLFLITKNSFENAELLRKKADYAGARRNYRIAFLYPGALQRAKELEGPAEFQLGSEDYTAAKSAITKGAYGAAREYFSDAAEHFQKAGSYGTAEEQLLKCEKGLHLCAAWEAYSAGQDLDEARREAVAAEGIYGADVILARIDKAIAYRDGVALMEKKDYAAALEKFKKAGDHGAAEAKLKECHYHLGVAARKAGDLLMAKEHFTEADGYEDAKALLLELSVPLGRDLLEKRDFEGALEMFTTAQTGGVQVADLGRYISLCEAEIAFREGRLKDGISIFAGIPASFDPEEFDVPSRREMLDGLSAFTKLEGTYGSSNYDIKYVGSLYTHYYPEDVLKDQSLEIGCILEKDGTVTIKATASFYYFYKQPPAFGFGYQDQMKTVVFTASGLRELPGSITNGETVLYLGGAYPKTEYSLGSSSSKVTYNIRK